MGNFWKDKRVWIIGASSGIGEGLVHSLVKQEAKLIISSRNQEKLMDLKRGSRKSYIEVIPLDLEKHQELDSIAQLAWDKLGGLDVIFLNAGMAVRDLVTETRTEVEKKIMDINFWGPVVLAKALIRLNNFEIPLRLVVTSSLSGKYGVPKLAGYSASKHALHGYFESLRAETAKTNLKIQLVIPGFVRTNITASGFRGDGSINGKMQTAMEKGMDPIACAERILLGVSLGKEEFLVAGKEKYTVLLHRFFPRWNRQLIRSNPLQRLRRLRSFFRIS
jgi:dehydrogenase/reductase SDR family member 7B